MGASASRLEKAGGNRAAAIQSLVDEYNAGAHGWSAAQRAAYENPATRDAWLGQQIGESTQGKYHGIVGTIGKGLSTLAPIAALAIPGLGPLAAAAIAAGGSAAGRALQGKSVNVGNTLLTGATAGAGNALLKGQGIKALGHLAGGGGAAPSTGGAGGGGGFLHTLGGYAKDALSKLGGGNPLLGAGSLALGALGAKESSNQRHAIEAAANYRNQLLSQGLNQGEEAYASRAPLREGGMAAIGKYLANPRGLFQTPQ